MKITLSLIIKGFIAGFVATLVLSLMMIAKQTMGLMPQLDATHMLTMMAHDKMGTPLMPLIGWVLHFVIGTVLWGGLFAIFNNIIPTRNQISKGIIFGIGAWLLMMVGPMPMSGAGLFGMKMGMMAPIMTLVLHIVFGVVLGGVFSLVNRQYCCGGMPKNNR